MSGFLVIGLVGLLLLVATLLIGDVFESLNHMEFLGGDFFSAAGLAGFIGALGFVGAIIDEYTASTTMAVVGGVAAGVVVGGAVGWATNRLKNSGEGSAPSTHSLVGIGGTVISEVPPGGYGEVRLATGANLKINARSARALPAGTRVWVSEVLSATAVQVEPVDELPASSPDELPPSGQSG